jgi:hypothetical protein
MKKVLTILLVALMATGGFIQPAQAALQAVGPVNPAFGFPLWYQDTAGLRLDLCTDLNAICFAEPPIPATIGLPPNFPDEAFWWAAEVAGLAGPGVVDGLLVLAMEAAFGGATGVSTANEQIAFARIRIRIDVTVPGTYTVTHPFGTATYQVGADLTINETQDIGDFDVIGPTSNFAAALADTGIPEPGALPPVVNDPPRSIGPFLTAVNFPGPAFFTDNATGFKYLAPAGFVGQVTGSPFGTNVFRIEGPAGVTETDQFTLTGKVSVNQPAPADRAEYRVKTGKFNVQGFSAAVVDNNNVQTQITIHLGADNTAPVLGTALVDNVTGRWSFSGKSPISPGNPATSTVAIQSTADPGGLPQVLPLTLR